METCSQCGNPISDGAPKGVCPTCVGAFYGSLSDEGADDDDAGPTLAGAAAEVIEHESMVPEDQFFPGQIVAERYRIVSLIGRGGMGEVYRAEDLKLRQTVALKFLPREFNTDSIRREALINEMRQGRRVSHPNVCRFHDIGEVDGRHFISMEFIDGEHLGILLRRIGLLPSDKAAQLARQLCAGLAEAHREGVLHLDLKPANLMIDSRGILRITDFGLARFSDEGETADEVLSGTPTYMAPEQLLKGVADTRSDIYAVGLIIYEMFTGERIHQSKTMAELLAHHRVEDTSRLPQISERLDIDVSQVVEKCLQPDPAKRFQSALEVQTLLPGGRDVLAAAVAAGETLDPEAVAAADVPGRL
ncbi:MAG: serine/threonine protein kinase, partial [Verrucomicrobiales bacterium]